MIAPVAIYLSLQYGEAGERGWAVPMATDIAFVVGCMSLLGNRVPRGLGILMLSLAIVDDLMAVLVIAVFYTSSISAAWLVAGFVGILIILAMGRLGIRSVGMYFIAGVWRLALHSQIRRAPHDCGRAHWLAHSRTPMVGWAEILRVPAAHRRHAPQRRNQHGEGEAAGRRPFPSRLARPCHPLFRVETALHPWVAFGIMPLFALANAGVPLELDAIGEPVAVAVAAGLFFGKPLGIFGASWLTVKLGWAARPEGVTWPVLGGAAFLGGIGFTMALFIASLGLSGGLLLSAKVGIILGSFMSAVAGMSILSSVARKG